MPTADAIVVERMKRAGAHHHRQDQHAGVRARLEHLQRRVRPHAERLRPDEDRGRLERRRRGRRRAAHAAGRRRQRSRRLAAQSRRLQQRVRLPAVASAACRRRGSTGSTPVWACRARWRATCPISRCCFRCRRATTRARRCRTGRTRRNSRRTAAARFQGRAHRLGRRFRRRIPFEPGVLDLCRSALKTFEALGCTVEEAWPDYPIERVWQNWHTLRAWQSGSALKELYSGSGQARADEARGAVRGRERREAHGLRDLRRQCRAHRLVSGGARLLRELRLLR